MKLAANSFRDLEAFAKKENAERKRESEDINEVLKAENAKRMREAEALKEKMEKENRELQVKAKFLNEHFSRCFVMGSCQCHNVR